MDCVVHESQMNDTNILNQHFYSFYFFKACTTGPQLSLRIMRSWCLFGVFFPREWVLGTVVEVFYILIAVFSESLYFNFTTFMHCQGFVPDCGDSFKVLGFQTFFLVLFLSGVEIHYGGTGCVTPGLGLGRIQMQIRIEKKNNKVLFFLI